MEGWIKLHRSLLTDELWKDCNANQKVILITLLLMANHKPNKWIFGGEEYSVKEGEFITSLKSISEHSGCTVQVVRTALLKFEKHHFLTSKVTNKNRLISIVNWTKYQQMDEHVNKQSNNRLTSNQQAVNKQLTTNKNERMKDISIYSEKSPGKTNPKNMIQWGMDNPKEPHESLVDYSKRYKRYLAEEEKA